MIAVRRARAAFIWVGVIVPLALLVAATAIIAIWIPELPDPVAIHWSAEGADGYAPPGAYLAMTLGLGGGMIALLAAIALLSHRLPQSSRTQPPAGAAARWSQTARFLGGVNLGLAGMFAVLMVAAVYTQRGLDDAADAPDITGWAFSGIAIAVALAIAGWFLQPKTTPPAKDEQSVTAPMKLAPGEQAAWFATAAMGRPGIALLLSAVVLLVATTIWVFALDGGGTGWIMAAVTMAVILLIVTTLVFRVRVSRAGLLVRSVAGWPRWKIGADQISAVGVVEVNPIGEFGGWGLRIAVDGRMGVVLRTGEALQVTRRNGRVFVVTVDDAATAAAVLTAAVDRTDIDSRGGRS